MNFKSRSALTFSELKNKTDEIYEFGNDWGLYIDIEMNYQYHFREKKINRIINTLDRINENEFENEFEMKNLNENENEKNHYYENKINNKNYILNYFNRIKLFVRQAIIYVFIAIGLSFILENKNS
jgi:hypothetical protein